MTKTEASIPTKEPPHRRFQTAYDNYFQAVGTLHEDTRRRFTDIQFEYLRKQNLAAQSQNLKALNDAMEEMQKSYNAATSDTAPLKRHADAYRKYKQELRDAVASVDIDELDPLTMAAIGQSLSIIACSASQYGLPSETETTETAEGQAKA